VNEKTLYNASRISLHYAWASTLVQFTSKTVSAIRCVQNGWKWGPFVALSLFLGVVNGQENDKPVDPQSESGLDYYAQGGVVVDGIAYFTASDSISRDGIGKSETFPRGVAFDVDDFRRIKSYRFSFTYDSSPLVYRTKDGTWLVIAHEHEQKRTVALSRDTGEMVWMSAPNQPGSIFFGYSYYCCEDGAKIILAAAANGLHALSGEDGRELWWVEQPPTCAVTPCVDQRRGWVFYQCSSKTLKIRANDGTVLRTVGVERPNRCMSWNTVLVDDEKGYFVATYWYGAKEWDSAIRVFDQDLNLVWQKTGLPIGKKATLTYADGKLVSGSGNQWHAEYQGDEWKYIAAYAIATGEVVWKCDLSKYAYTCILNVPYYNGHFYAETQDGHRTETSKMFRIRATDGKLVEVFDYGRRITSCATSIIARGKILSGDLHEHRTVVTQIAEDSKVDWPGPFGDPQTTQMAAPREPGARLVPMREIGR
jgi:hypothetical protein